MYQYIRKKVGLQRAILLLAAKEEFAYRFSAFFNVLLGPLYLIINSGIWIALFDATGKSTLGGFTPAEMITYLLVTNVTWHLVSDDIIDELHAGIREGHLTGRLLKPWSYLQYLFVMKLGGRGATFVLKFVPSVLIFLLMYGVQAFPLDHVHWYVLSLLIAFTVVFSIKMILGMLAFWMTRPDGIVWIYNMVSIFLYGSIIPLSVYPESVQWLFLLLPFQFVVYAPAQLYLGRYDLAGIDWNPYLILGYGVLMSALLLCIVMILWRKGLRRYCGVGA